MRKELNEMEIMDVNGGKIISRVKKSLHDKVTNKSFCSKTKDVIKFCYRIAN